MDEVLRDLVVIGLIALVCFAGAVEYVYWRLGFDKILTSLQRMEGWQYETRCNSLRIISAIQGRKVA